MTLPGQYEIRTSALRSVVITRRGGRVELAVAAPGIRLAGAMLPWRYIERVVVGPSAVGIRLVPGTPLPDGVPGVVHDPRRPEDLHVRQGFPAGRLDTGRLVTAIRVFAPGVQVANGDPVAPTPRLDGGERRDAWAVVTDVRLRPGRVYRRSTFSEHVRAKPHPVVSFALPDGRQVIAESGNPAEGEPGAHVVVSYDVHDPTDVRVASRVPRGRWVRTW